MKEKLVEFAKLLWKNKETIWIAILAIAAAGSEAGIW